MKLSTKRSLISATVTLAVVSTIAFASNVTLPYSFQPNAIARAAEVNANFQAVKSANDDNQSQISALTGRVASLETKVNSPTCPSSTVRVAQWCVDSTERIGSVTWTDAMLACANVDGVLCPAAVLIGGCRKGVLALSEEWSADTVPWVNPNNSSLTNWGGMVGDPIGPVQCTTLTFGNAAPTGVLDRYRCCFGL